MKQLHSINVLVWIALIGVSMHSAGAAPREVAPPATMPYAGDRKPLNSDFVRLEWKDPSRDRTVPVKIYFPTEGDGPFPVIVFSHGLGGNREAYEYLGRQWAANGYIV